MNVLNSTFWIFSFSRWWSGFKFIITWSQKNVILLLSIIKLMTSTPIITDCICKDLSIVVKSTSSNRLLHQLRRFQLCSCIFIPKTKRAIWPYSSQSSMNWVKCYIIYSIDILISIGSAIRSMTFKCEIIFWILRIYVLYGYTTFYRSQCISCRRFLFISAKNNLIHLITPMIRRYLFCLKENLHLYVFSHYHISSYY